MSYIPPNTDKNITPFKPPNIPKKQDIQSILPFLQQNRNLEG